MTTIQTFKRPVTAKHHPVTPAVRTYSPRDSIRWMPATTSPAQIMFPVKNSTVSTINNAMATNAVIEININVVWFFLVSAMAAGRHICRKKTFSRKVTASRNIFTLFTKVKIKPHLLMARPALEPVLDPIKPIKFGSQFINIQFPVFSCITRNLIERDFKYVHKFQ